MSVPRTGSQTARTLIFAFGCSSRTCWRAEAPARQTPQVGESITSTRRLPSPELKRSINT